MDTVKPSLNHRKAFQLEDRLCLARALRAARMLAVFVLWLAAGAAMAQNFPNPLVNTAQVAVPANTSDPASGNNTATDSNALALSSDLSIVKTLTSSSPAPAGSTVTYQIVVSNAGPSNVDGAIITDTVPPQLTNVNWTCVAAGTSACGTTSGTGNGISLTADIDVGPANTITLTVTGTAPASGTIGANTATVAPPGGTTDPDPSDDTSTTPAVPVSAVSDLSLAKTLTSASPAPAGSAVTYQIVVSNAGPSDAIGATIIDTVPAQLTGVSWTCAAAGTSSCGVPGGTGDVNLTANVGVGAANTVTITVTGTAPASGTIGANTATVTPPGGTTDPNPGDNTDTENPVPVTPTVSIGNASAAEGDAVVFTVSLSGPTTSDVTVTLNTADATATAPGDYTAQTGVTVTIPAGSASTTVSVPTIEDALFEGNETFTATISNPTGAIIGTATGTGTITDDDAQPTVSIDSPSASEGDPMVFTVSLSNPSATDITVTLDTANGTATSPGDYTAQTGLTVTIPAGSTSTTVNVPTIEDAIFEGNETFTATISNPTGATIGTATGTGTIIDDETAPTLSIDDVSVSEAAGTATFTVTLSGASATPVTVDYATANGTAIAGSDYTAASGTLTFAPGATTQTIGVAIVNDATDEPDETYTVGLTNAVGATIADASGLGTILDDEATPTISVADATATEGSPAQVVVSLSAPSSTDVTVVLDTGNGTAVAPGDYTAQTGLVVTIPAGQTSVTVPIPTVADALFEGDETFSVTLSGPTGATLGDANATVTITDDDTQPTVSIDSPSTAEGDPMVFTVSLSNPSATDVTVTLSTANGTAVAPGDYTAQTGITVTIPAGSTSTTVNVPTIEDAIFEGNETFTATISNPTGATIGTATGTGTITDDDAQPTVSIDSPSAAEGDPMVFTVSLSNPSASDVTVVLNTADGTAVAPGDYTAQTGITVTIPAGSASTTVNVPTLEDAIFEGNETFTATIGNPVGAALGTATGTATITEDDAQPTVSIDSPSTAEGDPMVFTVSLSNPSASDVTVVLNTADGTAVAPGDYTAQTGITVTIPAGSTSTTVNVPTIEDALFEGNETFTATIGNPVGAALGTATGTGTITDDDAQPTVSIDSPSAAEGDPMVFTVSLSNPSATDITVTLNTANGTANAPGDYVAQTGLTVTIPAGSTSTTVNVPTLEDAIFEGNETFSATISNPTGATLGTATGNGTITDDEAAPTLSIDDVGVGESAGTATFTVSLSGASATPVTADYATTNGSATAGSDYTATSGTLTFAPGTMSQTIPVAIIDDNVDEPDETFTVALSNASGSTIADASGLGTIVDDEGTPTVSIDSPSAAEGDPMVFTVSLSAPSATPVTVTLNTANGTANAPGDYVAQTGLTVTIPAGSTSTTVNVPTLEDAIFEGNETFTATLSGPVGAVVGTATGTATITDDETTPVLSVADATATEGSPAQVVVSLSGPSSTDVTVVLNTGNGTATAPADYTGQTNLVVTIPAGQTSVTVPIATTADALFEGDETFTVTLSGPTGAILGDANATATIADDETAPALSIDDVSVSEAAGTATFTVTLSGASATPVTVDYATANATAIAGSDYTAASGTLTFAPGTTTQTFAVPIINDAIFEGSETYTADLSNAVGATIADASGLGTITDDESTPTVSIDSPSAAEGDPMVFTISLSNPSATDVTVTLNTANGTAVAPGDYTTQTGLVVTIPAGSTSTTVSVPTLEDALFEGNETFSATIGNPTGATLGTAIGTATIAEDDAAPTLSVADATATEGSPAQVVVSLSAPSATDVTVTLNTTNGTAVAPGDYTAQTGLLVTIPAGQTSVTVPIPTVADTLFEGDETFTATLSGPTGAILGDADATVTITDDDAQPTVSIDSPSASEGDSMVFTVSLSNPSATDITVTLSTANGTAVAPGDYTAQSGVTVTIPAGSTSTTVNVPTIEDTLFEGNETFSATISNPVGATLGTAIGTATITDDETAPTLSINDVSVGESAGTATFTVSLSGASATPVTVDYASANGTASAGSDYTAASGTLTFASGTTSQTLGVAIANDTTDEPDETYTVGLSNAAGATIVDNSGLGTIVDDDVRVIDAIADSAGSVPGTGGTNVVNVLANDTLDGTPINPADVVFTPTSNGPLTINPDGSVDVAPNTPAGTYTATYQICEAASPANCDSATVSITVVAAAVAANDDAGSIASGAAGGTAVANVLGNDTVGGAAATTAQVLLSQQSSSHANVTLDTATGAILVTAGTPAGTYTLTYQVCEALNPSNCDSATATIAVAAAAVVANDDNVGPLPGSSGGTNVANVLANDTLGGAPIDLADVVLTPGSNGPLTINPDGSVDVAPNTPAGTYTATYQICERLNPSNCDSATVTIAVAVAVIDAVDDNAMATPVNGSQGGTALASVLANDRLGGAAANPGNVTLSLVSSTHANITLDPATGAVQVAAGTPAGTYTLTYRICEQLNPGNCDTATATIAVSAAAIIANNDAAGPITGTSGGTNVANVLTNDTLGGTTVDLVMVVFTPGSSGPLTINPDGSVDVAPDTPTGNYTATYRICERLNPANCASASITVSVQGEPATLRLTKTAAQRTARIGDLVRYTLRIDNIGDVDAAQVELFDRLPEGFVLAANSLQVADGDANGALLNARPLRVGALDIAAGRSATVIYVLRVGAGVAAGIHTNHAIVRDGLGAAVSNEATADVEVVGDPMLDDSLIVGSVFNDANGNGRQDAGERGLPGVRLGTVEGLLIETDQYGRFHLAGIDGGRRARGRNFLVKVDASTLPPGSRFTTENPRVLRVTPGMPVRFDFGVQVPGVPLGGGKTEVDIDLGQVFFEGRSATVPAEHLPLIDRIAGRLREAKGGSVAITANADDMVLAFHRAEAVRDALDQRLSPELRQATRIELRAQVDGIDALVTLDKDIQLGVLLFDTDKAAVKPQYRPLLAAIAGRVEAKPDTVVAISGYADARGTSEHNLRLSQRRADAVAKEISALLPAATRTCVRMEPRTPEQAATCPAGR